MIRLERTAYRWGIKHACVRTHLDVGVLSFGHGRQQQWVNAAHRHLLGTLVRLGGGWREGRGEGEGEGSLGGAAVGGELAVGGHVHE